MGGWEPGQAGAAGNHSHTVSILLFVQERDQVRIAATAALGHMLRQVSKFKSGSSVQKEIYTFLVPLLLSIQDTNTEVVKACGGALTEWTKVTVWSSLTEAFRHTTLSDHIHVLEETCKYLVSEPREARFLQLEPAEDGMIRLDRLSGHGCKKGLTIKRINMNVIHSDDVQLLQNVLICLKNDAMEDVQFLANTVLKEIDDSLAS
ncbi:hypothetical protein J0S82_008139, partial [Galemys pyrenaicus]